MHDGEKGHIWSDPKNVAPILETNEELAAVKTTGFDTRVLPDPVQFDFWRGAASNFAELQRPDNYEAPFHASLRNYFTPSIAYIKHEVLHASSMQRNQAIAGRIDVDAICIQLRKNGKERHHGFDADRLFTPGDVRIFELSKTVASENDSYENIGVILNKQELEDYIPLLNQLHGVTLPETAMTALLKSHLSATFDTMASMTQLEADLISNVTLEVLRAVLMSATIPGIIESESMDQPAFQAVIDYIDKQLHKPELSPIMIARAVGMSRSKLFRLCKPYGTPMELVRGRRMRRAKELMRVNSKLSISQLSYLVGYENRETFARIFKATFGYSARDFLQFNSSPKNSA